MPRVLPIKERQANLLKEVDEALAQKFPPTIMEVSRKLYKEHGYTSVTGFYQAYYRLKKRQQKEARKQAIARLKKVTKQESFNL